MSNDSRIAADGSCSTLLALYQLPKTGSVTLNRLLRATYGWRHADVEPLAGQAFDHVYADEDHAWTKRIHPRLSSVAGHRVSPYFDTLAGQPVHYGVMLRSPLERCISHYRYYQHNYSPSITIEEFLRDERHRNTQSNWLHSAGNANAAIEVLSRPNVSVGIFPNFKGFLSTISTATGRTELRCSVPHFNASGARGLDVALSEADMRLIEDSNDQDHVLFAWAIEAARDETESKGGLESTGQDWTLSARINLATNTVWRNSVYRPALLGWRRAHGLRTERRLLRIADRLRGRL